MALLKIGDDLPNSAVLGMTNLSYPAFDEKIARITTRRVEVARNKVPPPSGPPIDNPPQQ